MLLVTIQTGALQYNRIALKKLTSCFWAKEMLFMWPRYSMMDGSSASPWEPNSVVLFPASVCASCEMVQEDSKHNNYDIISSTASIATVNIAIYTIILHILITHRSFNLIFNSFPRTKCSPLITLILTYEPPSILLHYVNCTSKLFEQNPTSSEFDLPLELFLVD